MKDFEQKMYENYMAQYREAGRRLVENNLRGIHSEIVVKNYSIEVVEINHKDFYHN